MYGSCCWSFVSIQRHCYPLFVCSIHLLQLYCQIRLAVLGISRTENRRQWAWLEDCCLQLWAETPLSPPQWQGLLIRLMTKHPVPAPAFDSSRLILGQSRSLLVLLSCELCFESHWVVAVLLLRRLLRKSKEDAVSGRRWSWSTVASAIVPRENPRLGYWVRQTWSLRRSAVLA